MPDDRVILGTGAKLAVAIISSNARLNTNPAVSIKTTILFELPRAEHVRIKVYSATGQLVDVVTDEIKAAGSYAVSYQPSAVSASGIYILCFSSESSTFVRKMTFLK